MYCLNKGVQALGKGQEKGGWFNGAPREGLWLLRWTARSKTGGHIKEEKTAVFNNGIDEVARWCEKMEARGINPKRFLVTRDKT